MWRVALLLGLTGCATAIERQCMEETGQWRGDREFRRCVAKREFALTPEGQCVAAGHKSGNKEWDECIDRKRLIQVTQELRDEQHRSAIQHSLDNFNRDMEKSRQDQRIRELEAQQQETERREFNRKIGLPNY